MQAGAYLLRGRAAPDGESVNAMMWASVDGVGDVLFGQSLGCPRFPLSLNCEPVVQEDRRGSGDTEAASLVALRN